MRWRFPRAMVFAGAGLCACGPNEGIETAVVRYETQPMVVDVLVADLQADAQVQIELSVDPGVRIADLGYQEGNRVFRLRGLAPDTEYAFDVEVPGRGMQSVVTTTHAPLPGFVSGFDRSGAVDFDGYLLLDLATVPIGDGGSSIMLLDADGLTRWHHSVPSTSMGPPAVRAAARLLADGRVCSLHDYNVLCVDELGNISTQVPFAEADAGGFHHELLVKEDGGFFVMGYTFKDVPDPVLGTVSLAGDEIIELSASGEVVWRWNSFDHLDTDRRRPGIEVMIPDPRVDDPEVFGFDWTHGNGMVYEPGTDSLLISFRHQDWLVRVDRQSGEVVWRLGEDGDFDLESGSWFFHQHSPQWQDDGSLLLYDNGVGNPNVAPEEVRSRAVRYVLNEQTMVADLVWEDDAEPFVSALAGDADRLPNGQYGVLDSFMVRSEDVVGSRIRLLDPDGSPMKQGEFLGPDNQFVYRLSHVDRYVSAAP